jgi:hypothetical protein
MNHRIIRCVSCGEVVGRYPVFSHAHDEEDTGDAEYNEDYGGKINGDVYCIGCFPDTMADEAMEG